MADDVEAKDTKLPAWLASHLNIEWTSEDVDALLDSIDASQSPEAPTLPHLPAEILILILEFVPIAYVLDWRLVCRGFRDAIDGPIVYRHLQRARLIGYLGSRESTIMRPLRGEEYEKLHLMYMDFSHLKAGESQPDKCSEKQSSPLWSSSYAEFTMDPLWYKELQHLELCNIDPPSRASLLGRLDPDRPDIGFGRLIWAIQLDDAVLDLHLPMGPNHRTFDIKVHLDEVSASVNLFLEWKPMLFLFFKTETALRRLMEKKTDSKVSFSHGEDCLRAIRRQRLHTVLDPDNRIDRHLKWTLRQLHPLWGVRQHASPCLLDEVEADSIRVLLLLRRTAALTRAQIKHLDELAYEYSHMVDKMRTLSRSLDSLKSHLVMSKRDSSRRREDRWDAYVLHRNPIAWSDGLRAKVEEHVQRWKAQEGLVEQMQALMSASEDVRLLEGGTFDMRDSEF